MKIYIKCGKIFRKIKKVNSKATRIKQYLEKIGSISKIYISKKKLKIKENCKKKVN